jgi:hypothetical protein
MFRQSVFSDKRLKSITIVLIICIISIPFFVSITPYTIYIDHPYDRKKGAAGDTIEFTINLEMEGGHYIRDINIHTSNGVGVWEMEPKDTSFSLEPDSTYDIILRCHIPEDAQDNDEYGINYNFDGDFVFSSRHLLVLVDNDREDSYLIGGGSSRGGRSANDLGLSPLVFIPEAIIVICLILLLILIKNNQNKLDKKEQPGRI